MKRSLDENPWPFDVNAHYSGQYFHPGFYLERQLILGYASILQQTVPRFPIFSDHAV